MAASDLLVGCAEIDITPPLGTSLCGYFTDRKADGILDPLHAHAVVLRVGDEAIALVSCDLIFPSRELTQRVREIVEATTCVPGANVLVHATHTHTGPLVDRKFLPDAEGRSERLFPGDANRPYLDLLPELVASAVQVAANDMQPSGGLGRAIGTEERIAFNRRFHMKGGFVRTNPGRLHPDIIEPAAPADPSVLVLTTASGSPVLVNFAVHQDITGGCKISADMPAHMKRFLRGALGEDVLPVFFNGCCGDINHIDVSKETGDGYEHSVVMGQVLAGEVLKTLPWIEPGPVDAVAAASKVIDIPMRKVTPEELERAEALLAEAGDVTEWPADTEAADEEGFRLLEILWAHGTVLLAKTKATSEPAEIQALRIGDVGVVGLPGEIFCEHGLRVKGESPFAATMVMELSNEWHGYIPTRKAFGEGGYEVQHRSARLCEEAGDMMVDTAVELLNELAD